MSSVSETAFCDMWSGLTIISLSIIRFTVYLPRSVSPRVLQWGAGG